jgi:hypothetical protein
MASGSADAVAAASTQPHEAEALPDAGTALTVFTAGTVSITCSGPPAKKSRGRGAVRVLSEDPLVLELEEAPEPENRGRSVAEPAPGAVHWLISEDAEGKWWRNCNPDFAAALEVQRSLGVEVATFHFYPWAAGGTYQGYKRTYIHDLAHMVQVDTDRHLTWPLKCCQVVLSNPRRPTWQQG